VRALLDTGATVSILSRTFYDKHLKDIPIEPLKDLLNIECAGGELLPYDGYVDVKLSTAGMTSQDSISCLFLISNDTQYNLKVPALLGTNILSYLLDGCKQKYGVKFLQKAALHTPWYLAMRSMVLRERELQRNGGKLGLVRSGEDKCVYIPANSQVVLRGQIVKKINFPKVCALLQPTENTSIPSDLDIAPSIVDYNCDDPGIVDVHIANVTTQTVVVRPRALLCELQPVKVQRLLPMETEEEKQVIKQVEIEREGLSKEELDLGVRIIRKFADIFSKGDEDLGHSTAIQHRIDMENDFPFKQRHRRIPPAMYDEVHSHLQQLLSAGVIRQSHSPWASNVVLVRKPDGKLRMCVDYRQLNNRTLKDSYALPRVEELLDCLGGMKYFSVLDMKSGYHQVELFEQHKQRTAFTVGPLGFYEYNRMPFGLCNAPATYQRLMEECLKGLHLKICLIYLDDLIIFSKTYEEHLERLELVFQRLRECGLKLSPKKCKFFKHRVKYVGYIVSEQGIEADPEKISKIRDWPTPTSPEEIRKFLGFAGYYRKFVKDFSKIARPLSELMPKTNSKKTRSRQNKQTKQEVQWTWGSSQEGAFQELKKRLTSPPVLGYVDYSQPFELHVDASTQGLGAVLYQQNDGRQQVLAYASRGLNKSERNYSAHKLEFLCLKWAITEKFHDYLYGQEFTVLTDNNPLTYVLTSAKLDATGHRWLAALSTYNFSISYRPGKSNIDADILSRLPPKPDREPGCISLESIGAICNMTSMTNLVESVSISSEIAAEQDVDVTDQDCELNARDWRRAQARDPTLNSIMTHLRNGTKPRSNEFTGNLEMTGLIKNFNSFKLSRGVLRRITSVDGETHEQLVLPTRCRQSVLRCLHDQVGHPGRDRTHSLIKERFFWPGMTKDIENHVKNCERCLRRKSPTTVKAPLVSIKTTQPLELVCMDFLTLEPSKGGQQHILVVTDHFTRYAQAYPTKNMTARTTAEVFFKNFVVNYGLPRRIHSDQGANFEGKLMKEVCNLTKMDKSRTTPYHPMGNGQCERFNRTLLNMLGTLDSNGKKDWKSHVGPLVHAYNSTRHETTGYSPFFLMYGRHPRLPVDLAFGLEIEPSKVKSISEYTKSLRQRLRQAYDLASETVKKSQARQKGTYDLKARAAMLEVGDRVLVKIVSFDGKHKIADKWEEDVYVVLKQPNPEIPVFVVGRENGEGKKRTLHRNLLLPIGSLPLPEEPEPVVRPPPKKTRTLPKPPPQDTQGDLLHGDEDAEPDDEDVVLVPVTHPEPVVSVDTPAEGPTDGEADVNTDAALHEDHSEDEETEDVTADDSHVPDVHDDDPAQDDVPNDDEDEDETEEDSLVPDALEENSVEDVPDAEGDVTAPAPDVQDIRANEASPVVRPLSGQRRRRQLPTPPQRRSERPRTRPQWQTSGDYVMQASATPEQDWIPRAEFLSSLIAKGVFSHHCDYKATEALVDIVSGKLV